LARCPGGEERRPNLAERVRVGQQSPARGRVGWDTRAPAVGNGELLLAGSSSVQRRCLVPRLATFRVPPHVIPDGGISPVRLGAVTFPKRSAHESPALKPWPASTRAVRVCLSARRTRCLRSRPG